MDQVIISGLANGCLYALITVGFSLVYVGTGIVNFTQGVLVVLGGSLTGWLFTNKGISFVAAILISMAVLAVIGALMYMLALYPLRKRSIEAAFVSTIGLSVGLQNIVQVFTDSAPQMASVSFLNQPVVVGPVTIRAGFTVIFGATVVALLLTYYLLTRTRAGRALRATAEDRETAELMGIATIRSICFLFMIGAALAALAGGFLSSLAFVVSDQGNDIILIVFVAAVIGGFRSVGGGVLGALAVGLAQALLSVYVSSTYAEPIIFASIIVLLYMRPQGIFGERVAAKV